MATYSTSTMDIHERANKMARLVFNKDNLKQVKEGLDQLLDIFIELMTVPFEHGNCFSHEDLMTRLEMVEQKRWRPLRNMFLLDPFYGYDQGEFWAEEEASPAKDGYVQGEFWAEEEASPAKLLLDLLSVFNQLQHDLLTRLQGYQQIITTLTKEKREAEVQLSRLEMKECEQRLAASQERTELKTVHTSIEFLQNILKEKNERIAELQREKNVQLWQREKEKMLAGVKTRMDYLQARNEELQQQNQSLRKRLAVVDDHHKRLKMKAELMAAVDKSEEDLKRLIYLQEKDLTAMERELMSQQRIFSTVLCGMKTDLFLLGETLTDRETGLMHCKEFARLTGMVDKLATAMANGNIESAKDNLPTHYTYLPSDFKVKRIKRLSNVVKDKFPSYKTDYRPTDENGANGTDVTPEYSMICEAEENPRLVNPDTNTINFVNCMKHFPHLSLEFIKEHWVKFKEYDFNGDKSLDFSEVVRALTAMGLQFTAQQAEEAMREADVNQNRTLDFFEYILVADKLIHKTGRSELFHASPQDRRVLSKTCVVQ